MHERRARVQTHLRDVDCDAARALLGTRVQGPRPGEGRLPRGARIARVSVPLAVARRAQRVHDAPEQSGLTSVHVPQDHHVQALLPRNERKTFGRRRERRVGVGGDARGEGRRGVVARACLGIPIPELVFYRGDSSRVDPLPGAVDSPFREHGVVGRRRVEAEAPARAVRRRRRKRGGDDVGPRDAFFLRGHAHGPRHGGRAGGARGRTAPPSASLRGDPRCFRSRHPSGFLAPRSPRGLPTSRRAGFLGGQRSGVVRAKLVVVVVIVVVVLVVVIVRLVVPAALTAHRATGIDHAWDPAG